MGLSLSAQGAYFLWSLALGLAMGAAYDILRAVRMLFKLKHTAVTVTDILFFTLCGFATSILALPFNKGEVRVFVIAGEAAAFLLYRLTVGSIMGKIYAPLTAFLRKFIQKIHKIIEKTYDLLLKMTHGLVYNVGVVIDRLYHSTIRHLKSHRSAKVKVQADRKDRIHEQKKFKKSRNKGGGA